MEWLNYHHLYYFWVVCQEGGFSKAAVKLRVAQSAVSLHVAKLEDHLGQKLLERLPRGIRLTEAGQFALDQAGEIFRQGGELLAYFHAGGEARALRIGTLSGLSKNLQMRLLKPAFQKEGLEVRIEMGDAEALSQKLSSYQLDAVLSDFPFTGKGTLLQKEILREPVCLVVPHDKRKDALEKICAEGIYLPGKSNPTTTSVLDYFKRKKLEVLIKGYIDDIALLRLLPLEVGSGVIMPRIGVARELENKDLFVAHEFKGIAQSFYLIFQSEGKQQRAILKILKILEPVL